MLVIYLRSEVCENAKKCENTYSMSEVDIYPSTGEQFLTGGIHSPRVDADFSCEVCDKTFEKKQDLQRHYSFHIVGKPFVCKKCDSSFMRESAVTMHKCPADVQPVQVHTEVPKQRTSTLAERVKPKNEKPYICEVCDVQFMCKSNLKVHLKKNNCITSYNCTICRCNFKQLSSLARHHNKIHLGVDVKEEPEENNSKSNQPDLPHTCEVCGMKFSKKVYLIQHLPVHKGEKALTEFQENLEKEEMLVTEFEKEISKRPSKCDICGQKFTKRYDILRHMSTHTGEKAYRCDVCGKHYISKATLTVHRRRFHSGVRPFACDLCPRAFLRKPELETHYFTHKEYKPYTCGDCKTGFCHRKSLERHIRMQTCVGAPQNAPFENIDEMYDDSTKDESNFLKASGNTSDSDDLDFSWPQSDMRRTRSRTALIARQKASLKAFKRLSKTVNNELVSKNFELEHLNEKLNGVGQNLKKLPSSVAEQSTLQQYFPSRRKRHQTSITEISHLNLQSSANEFNSTDEESYVFSCNLCHEVFRTKQGLLKHYSVHSQESSTKQDTKKNLNPYVCNTCGMCFRLKRDLASHSDVHKPVKDYICVGCNLLFDDESHFNSHACEDNKLTISEQSFEKLTDLEKQNEEMMVQQENNLFECSMCSKCFEFERDLKYHLASHALNKGFFCNICPKAFYLENDLNNHVLSHSKKKFACKLCYENYNVAKSLKRHLLTHWSSGFICKHCHEGFDTEEDLKKHVDACPSKDNFICNVCHRSFLLKCALVSHAKTHQQALEENQFTCKFCGRSFLKNLDLRQHLRSHSGERRYFCQECGKGYFLKASLRAHLRYHSVNRPHACDRCDKKYVCKRDLDIHYLKHTDGVASYICDDCGQGFCLEKGLEKHLISKHGKTYKKGTKKKQEVTSDFSEMDIL